MSEVSRPAVPTEVHQHFVVFRKAVRGSQIAVNNGSVHQHQVIHQVIGSQQITLPEVQAMVDAVRRLGVSPAMFEAVRQAAQTLRRELGQPSPDPVRLSGAITRLATVTVTALDAAAEQGTPQAAELASILRPLLPTTPGVSAEEGEFHG
ncbi:hypothetical protein ACWCPF_42535 [Streptomyces sp. NPDC001858]